MSKKELTITMVVNADTCATALQKWLETCPHAHYVDIVDSTLKACEGESSDGVADETSSEGDARTLPDGTKVPPTHPDRPAGPEGQSDAPASDGAPAGGETTGQAAA